MIKHIMMVNLKPGISQQQQDEFSKMAVETLSQVPGAHNVIIGRATEIEGKARYNAALFIDFDDEAALKRYIDDPKHKAVSAKLPAIVTGDFLLSNYVY